MSLRLMHLIIYTSSLLAVFSILCSYCSKECHIEAWERSHKQNCHFYKDYLTFAKKEKNAICINKVINFWLAQEQLEEKPLRRDNAARICNTLLCFAYQNRQIMGHTKMLKFHILNAALLRQSCNSSVRDIADSLSRTSKSYDGTNIDKLDLTILNSLPYLKAGFIAVDTNAAIDQYLKDNHADDTTINDWIVVEGQVMVEFLVDGEFVYAHHIEISSDLGKVIRSKFRPSILWRFTYWGDSDEYETLLNPSRKIIPYELDMISRGQYTFEVSKLTDEEVKAQNCIASFMLRCHIQKQVKVILARNIISDFVWRCNEKQKARDVISTFIWKYHQQRKARRLIGNLIWSKIALQRHRRSRGWAISIQKVVRGVIARGTYLESLQPRLDAVRHFYAVWKKTIEQVPCSVPSLTGWGLVRERLDLKRVDLLDEDGNLADIDKKLNQALSVALIEEDKSEEIEDEEVEKALSHLTIEEDRVNVQESMVDWSLFQVSVHISCASYFVVGHNLCT